MSIERNIPIIVMEPVRGGMLADLGEEFNARFKAARPEASVASWALRYVASLPGDWRFKNFYNGLVGRSGSPRRSSTGTASCNLWERTR